METGVWCCVETGNRQDERVEEMGRSLPLVTGVCMGGDGGAAIEMDWDR